MLEEFHVRCVVDGEHGPLAPVHQLLKGLEEIESDEAELAPVLQMEHLDGRIAGRGVRLLGRLWRLLARLPGAYFEEPHLDTLARKCHIILFSVSHGDDWWQTGTTEASSGAPFMNRLRGHLYTFQSGNMLANAVRITSFTE